MRPDRDDLHRALVRGDRPLREADLRDLVRCGGADLAHRLLARDIHARRQAISGRTQAFGAVDPSSMAPAPSALPKGPVPEGSP